jgi:hypothetical protein
VLSHPAASDPFIAFLDRRTVLAEGMQQDRGAILVKKIENPIVW